MVNYDFEVLLARYQQQGYYNDPDFLIPDWPWLTLDEKKSQFALWSSFSAPLIISAYIPDLTDGEVEYLRNKDVINVDQDPLALQATLVSRNGYFDVLTKSLVNGDRLLTVLNRGDDTNSTTIGTERMDLERDCKYNAMNLWTGDSCDISGSIDITLATHATAIYRISGVSSVTPTGMIFNTASLKCMTAAGSNIAFDDCVASDARVWQVSPHGTVNPLAASHRCLQASRHKVSLDRCNQRRGNTRWVYRVTGNLVNEAISACLQQSARNIGACGEELDDQVFALPSGVEVARSGQGID